MVEELGGLLQYGSLCRTFAMSGSPWDAQKTFNDGLTAGTTKDDPGLWQPNDALRDVLGAVFEEIFAVSLDILNLQSQ